MREDICKRIKTIRNNLGMNKNEFANFLGITPQYLGSIENGDNCLSVEKIILLSQKTSISTDYILLGKENIVDERMIKHIMNINDDDLNTYFSTVRGIINIIQNS